MLLFVVNMFNQVGYMMYRACKQHILPWSDAGNRCYDKDDLYNLVGEHEQLPFPKELTTLAQGRFCDTAGCNSNPMIMDDFCGGDPMLGGMLDSIDTLSDMFCNVKCKNGDCLMKEQGRCDGVKDCSDGSDEASCGGNILCSS